MIGHNLGNNGHRAYHYLLSFVGETLLAGPRWRDIGLASLERGRMAEGPERGLRGDKVTAGGGDRLHAEAHMIRYRMLPNLQANVIVVVNKTRWLGG